MVKNLKEQKRLKIGLIKNTIKTKLGAEKFVNDGMFGLITEKVNSQEDLPKLMQNLKEELMKC